MYAEGTVVFLLRSVKLQAGRGPQRSSEEGKGAGSLDPGHTLRGPSSRRLHKMAPEVADERNGTPFRGPRCVSCLLEDEEEGVGKGNTWL